MTPIATETGSEYVARMAMAGRDVSDIVAAIEAEARADLAKRIAERVAKLDSSCHDREGLDCERDSLGNWCYSIDRREVLFILAEESVQ